MIVAGIDVGSISTKVVVMDGLKTWKLITATGWTPGRMGEEAYLQLLGQAGYTPKQVDCVIGTGYGRVALTCVDKVVTEITCHARGAAYLAPGADLVVDIGGQDSKVIKINEVGRVLNFAMNDKCAAGTGRFLQVMAAALGVDVSDLARLSAGREPVALSSMCAVFAESEVIGLLAAGRAREEIIAGLHLSVARRIAGMAQRLGVEERVAFTGGVARNQGVRQCLERELRVQVVVPPDCQLAGAFGAALIARDTALGRKGQPGDICR